MTTECAVTPGSSTGNPVTNPTNLVAPTGDVTSYTGAQPANANNNGDPADQYVAKHFPTGWFASLTGESAGTQNGVTYPSEPALNEPTTAEYDGPAAPTTGTSDDNCDANHVANLDDPTYGLAHDLSLPANEVPAFNWITPNNCSDAHDATCQGNNLSGAFNANGSPNYTPAGLPADDPEATTPANYTGGLYAADLFLRYYIPMIEKSQAFADGGMIDITFDEANPPFTVGNSFNNVPAAGDSTTYSAPQDQPTFGSPGTTAPGANSLYGAYGSRLTPPARIQRPEREHRADGSERPRGDQQLGSTAAARTGRCGLHRPADWLGRREHRRERLARHDHRAGGRGPELEPGNGLQDQRRRHGPAGLGHGRRRQHDPARHLRRRRQ